MSPKIIELYNIQILIAGKYLATYHYKKIIELAEKN